MLPRPDEALPQRIETHDTRLGWRLVNPAMKELHGLLSMGETAEEVAARHGVSRRPPGRVRPCAATNSPPPRARTATSTTNSLPVERPDGIVVEQDECVREDTSLEKLSRLRPVFPRGRHRDRRERLADE